MSKTRSIVGKRFGKLVVLHKVRVQFNSSVFCCRCDCGESIEAFRSNLTRMLQKDCGCRIKQRAEEIVGKKFGKLTVISYIGRVRKDHNYKCLCDCGSTIEVLGVNIKRIPGTKSCGCSRLSTSRMTGKTWSSCKSQARYRDLEWALSREVYDSIVTSKCHYCGAEPSKEYKFPRSRSIKLNGIDRKDNSKGYTTDNCLPCCSICNRAKHSMEYKDFTAYLCVLSIYRSKSTILGE